jgi:DNA-binding transcriptional LysR family regulator
VRLSSLDLNLLVMLDTVLAKRSVARAAQSLSVTPSAVSNALARLRDALGDPLVTRSGRGIVPTPRAAALAPLLARALRDLEQAVHGSDFDPKTTDRTFTLGISDAAQLVNLPPLVALLAVEMPRARLRVISIHTLFLSGGLGGTEVDVVIGVGEKGPGIHVKPLYEENLVLVARADHPCARSKVSKATLATLQHVDVEVAPGMGSRSLAASYAKLGVVRKIAVVVPTFTAAAAIVAATDHVASLPASVVDVLSPRLGLRQLATPVPPLTFTINVLWHERTHEDTAQRAFRDLLTRAAVRPPRPVKPAGPGSDAGRRLRGGSRRRGRGQA